MNLVMTEETLPSGESLLLPPWPGCAGHVKRSNPARDQIFFYYLDALESTTTARAWLGGGGGQGQGQGAP